MRDSFHPCTPRTLRPVLRTLLTLLRNTTVCRQRLWFILGTRGLIAGENMAYTMRVIQDEAAVTILHRGRMSGAVIPTRMCYFPQAQTRPLNRATLRRCNTDRRIYRDPESVSMFLCTALHAGLLVRVDPESPIVFVCPSMKPSGGSALLLLPPIGGLPLGRIRAGDNSTGPPIMRPRILCLISLLALR
jgi:hypothetical protein